MKANQTCVEVHNKLLHKSKQMLSSDENRVFAESVEYHSSTAITDQFLLTLNSIFTS